MRFIGSIIEKLQRHPKRVVFPEGTEPRILQAARQFYSLRLGAPIVFGVALRRPSGRYQLTFEPIDVTESGNREQDVDGIVAAYTSVLERWVRRAPEQYLWHHRRWKHQGEGDDGFHKNATASVRRGEPVRNWETKRQQNQRGAGCQPCRQSNRDPVHHSGIINP